ncbi:MAG: transglycosylase SLT domain-containing protein [Candidatus Riflebacteria bacterium]|nr:transglycosylase SLT domain-containing protein [Candidatus Riflebacteria bacterium]
MNIKCLKGLKGLLIGAFVVSLGAATSLEAAIYSYRDDQGRLFLTDDPPNKKYQIVITSRKDRENPDAPADSLQYSPPVTPQKILLPNDETFSEIINEAASVHSVDPYMIKAMIKVESDFDPGVVSSKGAQGLMQLIPSTARLVKCTNPFDPRDNIMGGTRYLRMMLERFGWDKDLAFAAYNSGPGRVEQAGGIPRIRETTNYVKKVNHYLNLYKTGAGLPETVAKAPRKKIPVVPSIMAQKLNAAYKIFQANDIEGAINAYQEIRSLYPKNTQVLYNLACLLDMERRYDEAIDSYKSALKQDPFMDKALYNLAIIYERLGQHKDAIASWRKYTLATQDEDKIATAERYIRELEEYATLNP